MFSRHLSRFRAAIVLAIAVIVWSDAALASFVCPHMSGCEHGMPASTDVAAAADKTSVEEGTPCCPVNSENTMQCDVSAMQCCAWHHNDSDVFAVLFASDHPRPKQIVALLPAAMPTAPSLIAHAHVSGLAEDLAYIKPVTQKKTDLRI